MRFHTNYISAPKASDTVSDFRKWFYLLLCWQSLQVFLWGKEYLQGSTFKAHYPVSRWLNLFSYPPFNSIAEYAPLVLCLLLFTAVFIYRSRILNLAIFILYMQIYFRLLPWQTTAGNLTLLLLFILVFIPVSIRQRIASPYLQACDESLYQSGLWGLRIQILLVYWVAGISKLYGSLWADGCALYYLAYNPGYHAGFVQSLLGNSLGISAIFTWLLLTFHFLFPIAVFIPIVRKYALWSAAIVHLTALFQFGLTDLSLIMLISLILFRKSIPKL